MYLAVFLKFVCQLSDLFRPRLHYCAASFLLSFIFTSPIMWYGADGDTQSSMRTAFIMLRT